MTYRRIASSGLALLWLALPGPAQAPAVGDDAPSFELEAWASLAKGEKDPSPANLKGKVVLIEFWGTWCAPCVRAMPRIQALHDHLKDRGLKVLAISYEGLDVTKPFAEKNGYSFTIGSDPAKRVVGAYGVKNWPTSVVIGKDGKVAYVGDPYSVETAAEKALGLETDPPKLLSAALDALASKDKKRIKEDLGRIADKPGFEVNLKTWAAAAGGAAPAGSTPPKAFDVAAEFARLVDAWTANDPARKKVALDALAANAPAEFDAAPWAKKTYGKMAPVTKAEFAELLKASRYDEALDALYLRAPAGAVIAAAVADKGLKDYATKKAADTRTEAKKATMCLFAFQEGGPRNNDEFWKEISVSGMRFSEDHKRITGILLSGGTATPSNAAFQAELYLARTFMMESLSAGKEPPTSTLPAKVAKDYDQLYKQLAKKYLQEAKQ